MAFSVLTTKGDIPVYTGDGMTRLPVGADGAHLVSDSSAGTGLAWETKVAATVQNANDSIELVNNALAGSARGARSVDLMGARALAAQAATGSDSALVGGENNAAIGAKCVVLGGQSTTASGTNAFCGATTSGTNAGTTSAQLAVTTSTILAGTNVVQLGCQTATTSGTPVRSGAFGTSTSTVRGTNCALCGCSAGLLSTGATNVVLRSVVSGGVGSTSATYDDCVMLSVNGSSFPTGGCSSSMVVASRQNTGGTAGGDNSFNAACTHTTDNDNSFVFGASGPLPAAFAECVVLGYDRATAQRTHRMTVVGDRENWEIGSPDGPCFLAPTFNFFGVVKAANESPSSTITVAELVPGAIIVTDGGSHTLPSNADLVGMCDGRSTDMHFDVYFYNENASTATTFTAGSGMTIAGTSSLGAENCRRMLFYHNGTAFVAVLNL